MKEKPIKKTTLRRDGPISLHPLSPEQALSAFMRTPAKKVAKKKSKKKAREK